METLVILGKYFVASAVLFMAYWCIVRHRASYRLSRAYLLLVPVMSLVGIMQFRLTLTDNRLGSARVAPMVVHVSSADVAGSAQSSTRFSVSDEAEPSISSRQVASDAPLAENADEKAGGRWLEMLIAAVSLTMFVVGLWQVGRLLVIRARLPRQRTADGYDLIRSADVATPFSFARTIFLPADLDAQREAMVLMHEKAHIVHRHYLEVWATNLSACLAWFNPVTWLCRAELLKIHEFEADSDVLRGGIDRYDYQMSLLQMSVNVNCAMVSGFSQSLIRQRFVEMKSSMAGTLSRRGKLGLAVWVGALIVASAVVGCQVSVEHEGASANVEPEFFAVFDSVPRLDKPEVFTLQYVDSTGTDTEVYIWLSDDFFHFCSSEPDDTLHLVGGAGTYQIELDHVIGMKVKPTRMRSSYEPEIFCVPGDTLGVTYSVSNDRSQQFVFSWSECAVRKQSEAKVSDYVAKLRDLTDCQSPHMPHFDCARWANPEGVAEISLKHGYKYRMAEVRDVFFTDTATILHVAVCDLDNSASGFIFNDDYRTCLEDADGNRYKFKGMVGKHNSMEAAIFGTYGVFEPLPKEVKSFSLRQAGQGIPIPDIRPREAGASANATLSTPAATINALKNYIDFETLCATYESTPGIEHIDLTGKVQEISQLGLKPADNTYEKVRRAEQLVVSDPKLVKQVVEQAWGDTIPDLADKRDWRGSRSIGVESNKKWTALRFSGDTLIVTYAETSVVTMPLKRQDLCEVTIDGKNRPDLKTKQQAEAYLKENHIDNFSSTYWTDPNTFRNHYDITIKK